MYYISTRGRADKKNFLDASMTGLAKDGGLYLPELYPSIKPPLPDESYTQTACRILAAFAGKSLQLNNIKTDVQDAYQSFDHKDVTPLRPLGENLFLLELHHGPSLAFKDVAMRYLARLYDRALRAQGRQLTILCATSGDTGGAAANAFANLPAIQLVVLLPHQRIARRQRLFITATGASNVHALALTGDFDACQDIVKTLFAEQKGKRQLSAVNSINWCRIVAQSVYYATAQAAFKQQKIRFVVPTGNFGDGLAAWLAWRCGLLNELQCVLALNANNTMQRLLRGEPLRKAETLQTHSPAMDIQSPSNLERLLYVACGNNSAQVRSVYEKFAASGTAHIPDDAMQNLQNSGFSAYSISDEQTLAQMQQTWEKTGVLVCPHTAVGLAAANKAGPSPNPTVVLATAHAAKFPETVHKATGQKPALPDKCKNLEERKENFRVLPANVKSVRDFLASLD